MFTFEPVSTVAGTIVVPHVRFANNELNCGWTIYSDFLPNPVDKRSILLIDTGAGFVACAVDATHMSWLRPDGVELSKDTLPEIKRWILLQDTAAKHYDRERHLAGKTSHTWQRQWDSFCIVAYEDAVRFLYKFPVACGRYRKDTAGASVYMLVTLDDDCVWNVIDKFHARKAFSVPHLSANVVADASSFCHDLYEALRFAETDFAYGDYIDYFMMDYYYADTFEKLAPSYAYLNTASAGFRQIVKAGYYAEWDKDYEYPHLKVYDNQGTCLGFIDHTDGEFVKYRR